MNRSWAPPAISEASVADSANYQRSKQRVGYTPRSETTQETYTRLGFRSGLEIHQQLLTEKKLFCHCPAGIYQHGEFDAEVIRHMRPTLSEMGEYDGTALMEKKTRKTIIYRIKYETACTYDIDDTPPFKINRKALAIALEISLMLRCSIVGELHITRKQYLDGSIPTGFQRTGIVGIEGEIPLKDKKVRIIQISVEEDACREVSDIGHTRTYTTDRLGMPLIETVTYPDMLTPDEVAEAAHYLRLLVRTSGKVRTGIGAARQDVNVSIKGGTRVEIKGVSHIKWIPNLTHNEAFRQKALLLIREELNHRIPDRSAWQLSTLQLGPGQFASLPEVVADNSQPDDQMYVVHLPGFRNVLSFFTQPNKCFADELSGRLRVIACLVGPDLVHSEGSLWLAEADADRLRKLLGASEQDAQLLFRAARDDVPTALETIEERCRWAFEGVPNETRKALPDGTTIFERVLPGPDRMYPDTDSAPIPIESEHIESIRAGLCTALPGWLNKLRDWRVPSDTHHYLIRQKIVPVVETIIAETGWPEKFVALLFGHTLKALERKHGRSVDPDYRLLTDLCRLVSAAGYDRRLVRQLLPAVYEDRSRSPEQLVEEYSSRRLSLDQALTALPALVRRFEKIQRSRRPGSCFRWIVGQLKKQLAGQVVLSELAAAVGRELNDV